MTEQRILPTAPARPSEAWQDSPLRPLIEQALDAAGGWLGFDAFMAQADGDDLYEEVLKQLKG